MHRTVLPMKELVNIEKIIPQLNIIEYIDLIYASGVCSPTNN